MSSEKRGGVLGMVGRSGRGSTGSPGTLGALGLSGALGPLLRQAQDRLRQAQGRPLRQAQGRFSGDAGMWFDSALRRLRAGSEVTRGNGSVGEWGVTNAREEGGCWAGIGRSGGGAGAGMAGGGNEINARQCQQCMRCWQCRQRWQGWRWQRAQPRWAGDWSERMVCDGGIECSIRRLAAYCRCSRVRVKKRNLRFPDGRILS